MTHFQIDLPGKVGELVEVTESNMRMAVFLLLLKSRFKRNEFEVNETGVAEAQVYFDENIINDAMALHLTNHANLRRFLTKGARVKVMRLLPS